MKGFTFLFILAIIAISEVVSDLTTIEHIRKLYAAYDGDMKRAVINDIARRMKQVDKNRAQYRQMFADSKWGAKETYHLCVNTSGHQIKDLIPGLAAFVRCWYGEK